MMKIFLTEAQYENIEKASFSENGGIIDNDAVNKMLDERYDEVLGNFTSKVNDIPTDTLRNKLSKFVTEVNGREAKIRQMLERLCFDTLFDSFGIEDDVEFSCEIVDSIDDGMNFRFMPEKSDDVEYDDYNAVINEKAEIEKRKIINCLIAGGASRIMRKMRRSYIDDLFELDEELPHLYSKIMSLNDYLIFKNKKNPSPECHLQSGFVKVSIDGNGGKSSVDVKAENFPSMLYESVKGILEIIASHGLPDNPEDAKRVIKASDALVYDPFNMKLGPILWDKIFGNREISEIPDALYNLVTIEASEFNAIIKEISYKTKKGREFLNTIFDSRQ